MRIATVDAVKDGVIHVTMSIDSRGLPIAGQYVIIGWGGETTLGRITGIDLTNPIHNNDAFAPYIMVHGLVQHWSGEVDIERGRIEELARVNAVNEPCPPLSNPPSGTTVTLATEEDVERFLNERVYILTLGVVPNSRNIPFTVVNRHFGEWRTGGNGEAKHFGIFGQTGSGKSVFALMRICGLVIAHQQMGLIIPDTAGDLIDSTRHDRHLFKWNYLNVLNAAGIKPDILDISDVRLTSKKTLKSLLAPVLRAHFNMDGEKSATLADRIVEGMFDGNVKSNFLTADAVLGEVIKEIGNVYARGSRQAKEEEAAAVQSNAGRYRNWTSDMAKVRSFFDGREDIGSIVYTVLEKGRKVLIRMDDSQDLTEEEQAFVLGELMNNLVIRARIVYKDRRECNALVVLDEAHKWVPEGDDEDHPTSRTIKRAFNETRKYGLGWMVISQRISHVSKGVVTQMHTKYFGRGLNVGTDRVHLKDHLGQDGLEAYERLQRQGGFFWVGIGDDANLGTSGTYFTLHPFGGDATQAFIKANVNKG